MTGRAVHAVRVLLDVTAVPGRPAGAGVYTCELARGLTDREEVELHLASRTDDAERWARIAPGATVHAVAPPSRPARIVWEQAGAARLAAAVDADVWHGPHYTMPLRIGIPTVVTVHDLTFFDHPEWHERAKVTYFRRMIRASARRANALVCVSEFTATRLGAVLPSHAPVTIALHGVDHARFRVGQDREADRATLARHGVREPYVAFVGTIEPRKDLPVLVHAFAHVALDHPDLRLVIAGGDGWGAVALRDSIATSGVATRVMRIGYVEDAVVPALFRRAVAVAYAPQQEGFGVPALEALACGAALVTTTGSALAEVVGRAAATVPPGDVDALAGALRRLVGDEAYANGLREAGPPQAAPFTWARSVEQHVRTYRAVAHDRARSSRSA